MCRWTGIPSQVMTTSIGSVTLLQAQAHSVLVAYRDDPQAAASEAALLDLWDSAEPEPRAALLLYSAWEARDRPLPADDTTAGMYAAELHTYAREYTGTQAEFIGLRWPDMPLPGQAGALASSLGFDRDDTDISLATLLLLLAAARSPRRATRLAPPPYRR